MNGTSQWSHQGSGDKKGTNSNFWTDCGIVDMECIMREANLSVFQLSSQISWKTCGQLIVSHIQHMRPQQIIVAISSCKYWIMCCESSMGRQCCWCYQCGGATVSQWWLKKDSMLTIAGFTCQPLLPVIVFTLFFIQCQRDGVCLWGMVEKIAICMPVRLGRRDWIRIELSTHQTWLRWLDRVTIFNATI